MSSNATSALHPFFSKLSSGDHQPTVEPHMHTNDAINENALAQSREKSNTKPKIVKSKNISKSQSTLGQVFGLHAKEDNHDRNDDADDDAASSTAADLDDARRKRRRISHTSSMDVGNEDDADPIAQVPARTNLPTIKADTPVTADGARNDGSASDKATALQTPPKKMLKLSASGKLRSPAPKTDKCQDDGAGTGEPKKRGRSKKSKDKQLPKSLMVCINYSKQGGETTPSVGSRINQILLGELTVQLPPKPAPSTPKKTRTPRKPTKQHPFFADKAKVQPMRIDSPRKTAAITPGKLRTQTQQERGITFDDIVPITESALLKDRLMVKHPGAQEPLWPAKGMSHVRGDDVQLSNWPKLKRRKQKHSRPVLHESVLAQYAKMLVPEEDSLLRKDGFREPHADLRIPERLLMSGADIASKVVRQLKTPVAQDLDELSLNVGIAVHPALEHLYRSIHDHLSAYDNLQGEQYSWTQKYAPSRAEHVLHPQKEMNILKTWLQSLAVNSVDAARTEEPKRRKRRKIRHAELDDFIVDEDDDIRSMDNISDADTPSSSIVQSQVDGVRASNVVLISGPHGCGKTAAVYAIAKELQYRVFEISSSERRAGKDVLDKVGNVTENHIVKRHNAEEAELSGAEDKERNDAAFKQDLESGRQGKMSAFFKPATKKISKPAAVVKAKVIEHVKTAIKRSKEQQQSLILLEEVDILFKEDKDFWTTMLKLILTSKRPFIMTCNDEDLVPMQAMQLHAVLRLIPADVQLAVNYLVLVAAREGHLLQRDAVQSLWIRSGRDLRCSLMMLDFWCQMGVGDIRNGLGWIYQRWPPNSDLDAKGRPLRVVSQHTYQAGMGYEQKDESDATIDLDLAATSHAIDYLSSIDIFSWQPQNDPTLPEMSEKRRAHFIEGMRLLDSQDFVDYTHLTDDITATALNLTRNIFGKHAEDARATLSRKDFATFDNLAFPISSTGMEASVFDGPFKPIVTEVAPYVRQVVRYEVMLQEHRNAISGTTKQPRKTRAARSALEGGQRQLTRREFWWDGAGDLQPVLHTAGTGWSEAHEQAEIPSSSMEI